MPVTRKTFKKMENAVAKTEEKKGVKKKSAKESAGAMLASVDKRAAAKRKARKGCK